MSATHVAGPAVYMNGRCIQRCCVCGEKLADNLNAAMPIEPDGSEPVFPVWEPWALVQIADAGSGSGGGQRFCTVGYFFAADWCPPPDFCLALVE